MVAQHGDAVADDLTADPIVRRSGSEFGPITMDRPLQRSPQVRRAPNSSGLYDVLDLILDKGIVIDAWVRVSVVGIELLTVDLRVVIASVDTYLRYAEGVERLNIDERSGAKKLPDMVGSGMKKGMMSHGVKKLTEAVKGGSDDDDKADEEEDGGKKKGLAGALRHGVRHILKKGVGGILHNVKGDSEEDQNGEDDGQEEDDGGEEAEDRHGRGREERGREDRGNRSRGMMKSGSRR